MGPPSGDDVVRNHGGSGGGGRRLELPVLIEDRLHVGIFGAVGANGWNMEGVDGGPGARISLRTR